MLVATTVLDCLLLSKSQNRISGTDCWCAILARNRQLRQADGERLSMHGVHMQGVLLNCGQLQRRSAPLTLGVCILAAIATSAVTAGLLL